MSAIVLPERCDRTAAEALLPEMAAMLGGERIQIDGSAVTQVGQAVLQLLVSARRWGEGARIVPSAALTEAARLYGLEAVLFEGDAA